MKVLLIPIILVAACSPDATRNPLTDRMDNFFDGLNRPPALTVGPPQDANKEGYLPAYPPINEAQPLDNDPADGPTEYQDRAPRELPVEPNNLTDPLKRA